MLAMAGGWAKGEARWTSRMGWLELEEREGAGNHSNSAHIRHSIWDPKRLQFQCLDCIIIDWFAWYRSRMARSGSYLLRPGRSPTRNELSEGIGTDTRASLVLVSYKHM